MSLDGLSVLIVEDEVLLRKQLGAAMERQGMDVTSAGTLQAARQWLADLSFDVALLDVNLPDGLGTDLLKSGAFPPHTAVVVMTANGGVTGAVEAMRYGAADYLVKPFDPAELPLVMVRARKTRQVARAVEHRQEKQRGEDDFFFFGQALAELNAKLEKILAADRRLQDCLPPVLIDGETGTGKSTIARWLHVQGPRAAQSMIEVNCSAIPETLAESELFGHERGSFTDARTARMGLFEAANGGTLFLDELPSLSPMLQAKVLTAIEDHKIRRVGANKPIAVEVRVIAATNRDLKQAVAKGEFREDLLHRLDLFRLTLPPLRERGEDIVRLAEQLVERLSRRHRLPKRPISRSGRERLLAYGWPGNVRELAHEIERAIVFEEGEELAFNHLNAAPAAGPAAPVAPMNNADWLTANYRFGEGFQLEVAINRLISLALTQANGNVSAAARLLGVSRDYVRYRLGGGNSKTGE